MNRSTMLLLLWMLLALAVALLLSCSHSDPTGPAKSCAITLTNPNSTSAWVKGENRTITWSSSGGTGAVQLELYKGETLLGTIAASTPVDGAFAWVVNDFDGGISSQYRVKITDLATTTCYAYSDYFTIGRACSFAMTNPTSSSAWTNGDNRTITWTSVGSSGTVKLELYKGGTFLCTVAASTTDDGSYAWLVDDCGGGISSEYSVKVTDTADGACYAYSDYFTIGQACSFAITNPTAATTWANGDNRSITWTSVGGSGTVKIELYKNANYLCTLSASTPDDGVFAWLVDNCGGGVSSQYRIKITDTSDNGCYAYSDYFTIGEACSFVISNPDSGNTWANGDSRTIMWSSTGGSGAVKLELYKGAAYLCTIAASTTNDGSYAWLVDDCGGGISSEYSVKVTDTADGACYAYSDYFTIGLSCYFVVTNPSSSSVWANGESRTIAWTSAGSSGTVKIELYQGTTLLCPIVASTADDKLYSWTVSDCGGGTSSEYKIRITDTADENCYGESAYFTMNVF